MCKSESESSSVNTDGAQAAEADQRRSTSARSDEPLIANGRLSLNVLPLTVDGGQRTSADKMANIAKLAGSLIVRMNSHETTDIQQNLNIAGWCCL